MAKRKKAAFLQLMIPIILMTGCHPQRAALRVTTVGLGEVSISPPVERISGGERVTLTASPGEGWRFVKWSGDLDSESATICFPLTGIKDINAVFCLEKAPIWNFLVYMDGDNNLERFAIQDFNEMEMIGSTDEVNVLVLFDRAPGYDCSNGDWTNTRLYRVLKDTDPHLINSQYLLDLGEKDMSDPNTLQEFLIRAHEISQAKYTVLTLWNHGGGVYPRSIRSERISLSPEDTIFEEKEPLITKGICWDDTTGLGIWDCLTTDQVASALAKARQTTGKRISVINTDACNMQLLEVAYEWRNEADYLVGSEDAIPGDGNHYTSILSFLTASFEVEPEEFATTLVEKYYDYYQSRSCAIYSALNMGAINEDFMNKFRKFAQRLAEAEGVTRDEIYAAGGSSTYFTDQNLQLFQYVDLYDFASHIGQKVESDPETRRAAEDFVKTRTGMVLSCLGTGDYQPNADSLGLAVNLPYDSSLWLRSPGMNEYIRLQLAKDTLWDEFINRYSSHGLDP